MIEEILLTSDIGVDTTMRIMDAVKQRAKRDGFEDSLQIYDMIKQEILTILTAVPTPEDDAVFAVDENNLPHTIMVVGVNGVGKTTTIGKLANNYKNAGKKVIIGAADTFRAAANETSKFGQNVPALILCSKHTVQILQQLRMIPFKLLLPVNRMLS